MKLLKNIAEQFALYRVPGDKVDSTAPQESAITIQLIGELVVRGPTALNGEVRTRDRVEADLALHAITPHRRLLSTRVRRLLDHLRERFGPRPAWDDGLEALGLARARGS